jgi:hypothetical protein
MKVTFKIYIKAQELSHSLEIHKFARSNGSFANFVMHVWTLQSLFHLLLPLHTRPHTKLPQNDERNLKFMQNIFSYQSLARSQFHSFLLSSSFCHCILISLKEKMNWHSQWMFTQSHFFFEKEERESMWKEFISLNCV